MAQEGHSDSALLLDAALENIPYGFCVWSSDFKLLMWNKHYLDIYSFPSDAISKGMSLDEVVKLSSSMGNHPDQTPQQFLTAYKKELKANKVEHYRWALPHVNHVFLPGHRIMVQVQSTLFPLYDRNPQTYVENIMYAKPADYKKATQSVWFGGATASAVVLPVVPATGNVAAGERQAQSAGL